MAGKDELVVPRYERGAEASFPRYSDVDAAIEALCVAYAESDGTDRGPFRDRVPTDAQTAFDQFARRAAVYAVRENDRSWLTKAVAAASIVDTRRFDYRDSLTTWNLVEVAASAIGVGASEFAMLARAVEGIRPDETTTLVASYLEHPQQRYPRFQVVRSDSGIGIIEGSAASASSGLLEPARRIADLLQATEYSETHAKLTGTLPDTWFVVDRAAALDLASHIRGRATVSARYGGDSGGGYQVAFVTLLLFESIDDVAEALRLGSSPPVQVVQITIAAGRLWCQIIAANLLGSQANLESAETLRRYIAPIERILVEFDASRQEA